MIRSSKNRLWHLAGNAPQNRGFTLVVTLSLLVLITIIAVGMLSLATISLRQTGVNADLAAARANARMALVLALGQLQEFAGDDRRITMAADQLTDSEDGDRTSATDERRHWTGVYNSWDHTLQNRPQPEFLSWLVSSASPGRIGADAPTKSQKTGPEVELVGSGTVGRATSGRVHVPTIELENGAGRIGWWTGDQGLKAMLALPEKSQPTDLAGVRSRLQASPVNAVNFASNGSEQPFSDIDFTDQRLAALTDWQQSAFFANSPLAPKPLFHDLAASSSGLLVNVREGGFRKDLSMYLERSSRAAPETALYRVGREEGINFKELWAYYNLYKELGNGSGSFTTGGAIPARTLALTMSRNAEACKTDENHFFKQPVIISYQMVFSLEARPAQVGGSTVSRLHIVADPILTFWNPLDVPVVIPRTAFFSVKYWMIPYDISIKINGGASRKCPLLMALSGGGANSNSDQNYLSLRCGELEQLVFKPGEVVKVSQSGDTIVKGSNSTDHNLQGRSGFNYGGGVSLPIRQQSGDFINLTGNERITYEFIPNNLTCGATSRSGNSVTGGSAHSRHFSLNHHEYYVGTDRGDNSLGIGGMAIDWDFGNQRLGKRDAPRQSGTPGTKNPRERLYASRFPEIFPRFTEREGRPLTASQLSSSKAPVLLVSYNAKTETGSDLYTKSLSRFNPKAHHVDFYDLSQKERDMLPYEFKIEPLVSWRNRSLETSPRGNAYFGGGLDAASGSTMVTTHSAPREPLNSLAALQHSFANGFYHQQPVYGYANLNGREPMLPQISHAIGNSLAPSILAPNKTDGTIAGARPVADHSYLANRELWDDWFFSSIAPQTTPSYDDPRGQKDVATAFFKGEERLPNSRYIPNPGDEDVATLLNRLMPGITPTTAATEVIASLLRVEGLFNVNSTSVEAWKTVLGGLNNRSIVTRGETGSEAITPAPDGIPVAGLLSPTNDELGARDHPSITDPSQWTGLRVLDEDEIDQLARAIVREVRKRGPFLSLADFVNRRVGSDDDLARSGAIQSALDSKDVSINSSFENSTRSVPDDTAGRFAFPDAEEGPISQGIPGIVKQADILTPIAPYLSVRSDSFIIRAYGETTSKTGTVLARAWCEATVERDNRYLTGDDEPETLPARLSNPIDKKFGRKFRIVAFRWLGQDEV